MFNGEKIERLENPEHTMDETPFESGLKLYEKIFHGENIESNVHFENPDSETVEIFQEAFRLDPERIQIVKEKINDHLEGKIPKGISDAEFAELDINEVLDDDDFIEIIKPLDNDEIVAAIIYWTTIKSSFVCMQNYEHMDDSDKSGPTKHEVRVRAVTELLLSLNPLTTIARFGYQFVTGKTPEPVYEKMDKLSELIVDASDATMYLTANAALGCVHTAENAVEYGGAAAEYLAGNEEKAKEIMELDIASDIKEKLDNLYGRDNGVRTVSDTVEKFGETATHIGLTMVLPFGGVGAVAAAVGMTLGKAGEVAKNDIEKTGELTEREMLHGIISGATLLAFAEIGNAGVETLGENSPQIAKAINDLMGGNIDPKLLKSLTTTTINGLEAGTMFAAYDVPQQVSKELERAFDIDPDAKGDWSEVLKGTGAAILTAATFTFIKELYVNKGFYSTYEERLQKTPVNNGEWTGERGESTFISENPEVNEILKEKGMQGIDYKDACPDFSEVSKGTVTIDNMSSKRVGAGNNFEQADTALAKIKGCKPQDVAKWRKANNFVWHEGNDMKTMQKVPFIINDRFGHLGGVAECARREKLFDELVGKAGKVSEGGVFDV